MIIFVPIIWNTLGITQKTLMTIESWKMKQFAQYVMAISIIRKGDGSKKILLTSRR